MTFRKACRLQTYLTTLVFSVDYFFLTKLSQFVFESLTEKLLVVAFNDYFFKLTLNTAKLYKYNISF